MKSEIWWDESWNPITGCTPISSGCTNCYAKRMANRLRGRFGYPPDEPFRVTFHPDRLDQPLRWKKSRKIFVCSMSDLFHGAIEPIHRYRVLRIVAGTKRHNYLALTKRPSEMAHHLQILTNKYRLSLPNLWLGVTAENQKRYDERWTIASKIPAVLHFVSIEPALESVNIDSFAPWPDWVIWGPESGPGRRPYNDEWAENTFELCREKNIPFFDKRKERWLAREFPK